MFKTKKDIILKIHLIISIVVVVPTAFVYGFQLDSMLDFDVNTIDEMNQFKAMMGLYLGFALLWILGVLKSNYLILAILTHMIFMLGLALGRLLSMSLEGLPSLAYVFGMIGELILGLYSLWLIKTKRVQF